MKREGRIWCPVILRVGILNYMTKS